MQYTIKCQVILSGAEMIVEASSPEEALQKAKRNDWEDIEWDGAELVDWTLTGKPKADD